MSSFTFLLIYICLSLLPVLALHNKILTGLLCVFFTTMFLLHNILFFVLFYLIQCALALLLMVT